MEPTQESPVRLGKYELLTTLGTGGMATVYLARHRGLMGFQKLVVIKRIHPHLAKQQHFIDMFLDEARIAAQISHHRVVQIYELGADQGQYFIAMEYLAGESLALIVKHGLKYDIPLPVPLAVRIISDAAEGLHAAHELRGLDGELVELVHRDVSPGNIVVLYDGSVKLVDFGVAKAQGRLTETAADQVKGKFAYMAPELLTRKPVDRRADVFSLGIVLWELLALRRLFRGDNDGETIRAILDAKVKPPSHYRREVPRELDAIVLRALNTDPLGRYQTAFDMRKALQDYLHAQHLRIEAPDVEQYLRELFGNRIELRQKLIEKAAKLESGDEELTFEIILDDQSNSSSMERLGEAPTGSASLPPSPTRSRWPKLVGLVMLVAALAAGIYFTLWRGDGDESANARADKAGHQPGDEADPEESVDESEADPDAAVVATATAATDASAATTDGARIAGDAPIAATAATTTAPGSKKPRAGKAKKPSGKLFLATIPRAKIYRGKRLLGSSPLKAVSLPAGTHKLTGVLDSGERKTFTVVVGEGEETRLVKTF